MPKVSAIIPTYNREAFVVKAVQSILKQRFTDYETIVVDDGSTDNTRKSLAPYWERITYIYQQNSGVSSALNTGIRVARGDWIAILGSDDEWMPGYLSHQVQRVVTYPPAVAHMTNATMIDLNGTRKDHFADLGFLDAFGGRSSLMLQRPLRTIIKHRIYATQTALLRRDVVLDVGLFDEDLSIAEDLDIICRVALRGSFTISSTPMVERYRRHEDIVHLGAQTMLNGLYSCRAFCRVYDRLLRSDDLTRWEKLTIAAAASQSWRALGNMLVLAGQMGEARRAYRQSLATRISIRSYVKLLGTYLPHFASAAMVRGRHMLPQETNLKGLTLSNKTFRDH